MKEQSKVVQGALIALVICLAVLAVVVQRGFDEIAQKLQPPAQTVVYIRDGQGSQGVPIYQIPGGSATPELLPNYTPVDMVCWADEGGQRWFYVRVSDSPVRSGQIAVVRAIDTHNQQRVDRC